MFISGAFAIFVSSGASFRKALCLLSTCYLFSYVGVVVGAILGTSLNLTVWIFAVIAGMFLYIALAEMVSGTYSCFQPPLSLSLRVEMFPLLSGTWQRRRRRQRELSKTNMSALYRIDKFHLSRWNLSVIVGTFWYRNLSNVWRTGNPDLQIREGPGDPDPEISGEVGVGASLKKKFCGPSGLKWSKNTGGPGPPGPPGPLPRIRHCDDQLSRSARRRFSLLRKQTDLLRDNSNIGKTRNIAFQLINWLSTFPF